MTPTNNAELIRIAIQIATLDEAGNSLRNKARMFPEKSLVRNDLEKQAWSLEDDICQLCTEMRIACLPVAA